MKGAFTRAHLFPVRHHSPRSSFVLRRMLDRVRPKLVLVEGPEDANPLIPVMVDPETLPPIAILGYRTDKQPGSALWPFASYSPEYVALAWAKGAGVPARFIDIDTGVSLGRPRRPKEADEEHRGVEVAEEGEPALGGSSIYEELAKARGHRSFEEFWEASFEAPDFEEASFREALIAYADLVRHDGTDDPIHRARDAFMARRIDEAVGAGTPPEAIVAVLGAAHAAALVVGDVDAKKLSVLPKAVPTATTLIPYSFPRLAEQTGYGAGNRAPQFYQRAWDAELSFRRAALEVLVEFSEHLRLRGFMASLADTIEAYRLACTLADLRGKSEVGLDEVREATVATMCRGDATHVDSFLWPSVVGRSVGKVASRVGKNSLQEEFWREVTERRLPRSDEGEEFVLRMHDKVQVATSIFLHRLRVADVPYAVFAGTTTAARRGRDAGDDPGGVAALSRSREAWHAQWTPATDVALVERIVLGETLEQVCRRILSERLGEAKRTVDAASVLLESVVASIPETASTALDACDALAATDDDLPSLASACRAVSGLVSYGTSRDDLTLSSGALAPLCQKTFDRALLRAVDACAGNDEAVEPVKPALRTLHEIAMNQPLVDRAAWIAVARRLAHDYSIHPACAGIAAGLLYLAREIDESDVASVVEPRVSDALAPERAADFLGGFLEVNALVLVRSRAVVAALDEFLTRLDAERFRDAVPVLRRAFSSLGPSERRYLVENVIALRALGGKARQAANVIGERDKARLAAVSEEVSKALADLDDLL